MQKQNIVFITGNKNKLKEVREILGDDFAVVNIEVDLQEIQSTDVKEVIEEKIKEADKIFRKKEIIDQIKEEFEKLDIKINDYNDFTVVCEDTGFHIDSINIAEKAEEDPRKKFPGALIKFYLKALGAKGIIKLNKGSTARLTCYIGVIRNGEIVEPIEAIVEGRVAGKFVEGGFGFDPCFVPTLSDNPKNKKSYAELLPEIKNQISHRSVAFNKLKKMLKESMNGGNINNFYNKYVKYTGKCQN
jgi:non-canonical purine NTP pyrophosphatase (RdgB/HAM1 family)